MQTIIEAPSAPSPRFNVGDRVVPRWFSKIAGVTHGVVHRVISTCLGPSYSIRWHQTGKVDDNWLECDFV